MMKKTILTILLSALALMTMAQQDETTLTLDSCRAMALRNQAKMRVARLEVEKARQTQKSAQTKYMVQVSGTAGAFSSKDYMVDVNTDNLEESGARLEVDGSVRGREIDPSDPTLQEIADYLDIDVNASLQMLDHGAFANVLAIQPIFAGGRIVNGNRLARLGVTAAELQRDLAEDEVMTTVEERYWMLHSLYVKREALNAALSLTDSLRRDAEAGEAAGVIGKNDLLKIKLKQNELHATQNQLEHGIVLATRALAQYIGLEYHQGMELKVDTSEVVMMPTLTTGEEDLDPSQRTEAQLLDLSVEAERLKKAMTIGESLPQIGVGATWGYNNLLSSTFKGNGLVFATVQVPLTAWWTTAHDAKKQGLEQQIAQTNRNDLMEQLKLQNLKTIDELEEAIETVDIRRQTVADAKDNMDEVGNYYRAGLSSVSEYMEAVAMWQKARADLADGYAAYRLAALRYKLMVGHE